MNAYIISNFESFGTFLLGLFKDTQVKWEIFTDNDNNDDELKNKERTDKLK